MRGGAAAPLLIGVISIHKAKIIRVHHDSIAERHGLAAGDSILEINGHNPRDIIDFSFDIADEDIELLIERKSGNRKRIVFRKSFDEQIGVDFESAVFDGIRQCRNHCVFCFVDMIAPNMRSTLSIKDDDYRMSFLYGNFITLTNLTDRDFERIKQLHLSPLYVSIHAMNPTLRATMLRTKLAADISDRLDKLEAAGADYHTQIVLCRGLNDGDELERTISELVARRPHCLSLAIVPVGITKHRCDPFELHQFDRESARLVIDQVARWQEKLRRQSDQTFVYLGDEFYFLAGVDMPPEEYYDDFPQYENGIGLTRAFITDWSKTETRPQDYAVPITLDVIAGTSISRVLRQLANEEAVRRSNLHVRVLPVVNKFFGETVNVSGLLTGRDIIETLKANGSSSSDGILIPETALRSGEDVFLDDVSLDELRRNFPTARIEPVLSGVDFRLALTEFDSYHKDRLNDAYTWQSNAGYSTPD